MQDDSERIKKIIEDAERLASECEDRIEKIKSGFAQVPYKLENILPQYKHFFNKKAQIFLNNVVKQLSFGHPQDGDFKQVRYLAKTGVENDELEIVGDVVSFVNDLANRGYLEGFLSPLGKLEVNIKDLNISSHSYHSFVLLNKKGLEYFDNNVPEDLLVEEGGEQ